jgi:hypothetical protein
VAPALPGRYGVTVITLRAERVARNEAFFREINQRAARRSDEFRAVFPTALAQRFMCECGDQGCTAVIHLSRDEYRAVRAHPGRFVLLDGHQFGDLEDVVERHDGYIVVEKRPDAME